jgi:hypothetical protein
VNRRGFETRFTDSEREREACEFLIPSYASLVGSRSTWHLAPWALVACSSAPALQGPGGRCFLVSDCKKSLVCVTQADNSRICSSDLSGIVKTEDSGTLARPPMADAGHVADVAVPSSGDEGGSDGGPGAMDDASALE